MAARTTRKGDRKPSKKADAATRRKGGAASALSSATARDKKNTSKEAGIQLKTDHERGLEVCQYVAEGSSVFNAAYKAGIEPTKFYRLLAMEPEGEVVKQYMRARASRADARFEKIDDIVDRMVQGLMDPNTARVAIDAIKWQSGKENSRRYGDKIDVTSDGMPLPAPVVKVLPLEACLTEAANKA